MLLLLSAEKCLGHATSIPSGLCACGCGQRTKLSDRTDPARGVVKGQPLNYVNGHTRRGLEITQATYEKRDCGHDTPCWVWTGATNPQTGYGLWGKALAHRRSYERAVGPIPKGFQIDHLCRNPPCINPGHLEAVTPTENTRRGDRTKLTKHDVFQIRRSGLSNLAVAQQYEVDPSHISRIRSRKSWVADLDEVCRGYRFCCECPSCLERQEKTASGEWHYDAEGDLVIPPVKQPWTVAA